MSNHDNYEPGWGDTIFFIVCFAPAVMMVLYMAVRVVFG